MNIYVETLAEEWVRSRIDSEENVSLIYAELSCDEREVLDMENQVFLDKLAAMAFRRNLTSHATLHDIHSLYESYVALLEKRLSTQFRLIRKSLPRPKVFPESIRK